MKKLAYALAAATLLAGSSFAMQAQALPAHPVPGVASDVVNARYHYAPRRVCTTRTIVTRGHHGHRIVKRVRTCRMR